jgi:UDP-glucuronate 4-epimerase
MDSVAVPERSLDKKADMDMLLLQPSHVLITFADVTDLVERFNYKPATPDNKGVTNFVAWYRNYFNT